MMLRSGKDLVVHSDDHETVMDKESKAGSARSESSKKSCSADLKEKSSREMSIKSSLSSISVTRTKVMEVELEAEEALLALANRQAENEKAVILKRLEMKKQLLANEMELEDERSDAFSQQDNSEVVSMETENLERINTWVNQHEHNEEKSPEMNKLINAMTDAFNSLGNNKQANPTILNKFLARQAAGKDLPTFQGDPEEWPGFLSQFEQSTNLCDFTDAENMLRLQRCLKGKAKDTVKSILYLPNQLDNVLQMLLMSFGRPAVIIKSMIARAKNLPSPREDKMESIIEFSNAVKNLVATMKILRCTGHMSNPQLVEELLAKLPVNLRMQWGMVAASLRYEEPNLEDFSRWLEDIAMAASFITTASRDPGIEKKQGYDQKPRNMVPPHRHSLFATGSESPDSCPFCKGTGHSIFRCDDFGSQSIEDKHQWVQRNKLCFGCLKSNHTIRDCRKKRECGLQGCPKFHHRLLHSEDRSGGQSRNAVGHSTSTALPCGGKTGHVFAHSTLTAPPILLRLLQVTVSGPRCSVTTHAIFDEGSTVTMMDAQLAKEIGTFGKRDPLQLRWTDNSSQLEHDSMRVSVKIKGIHHDDPCEYNMDNVRTVKNLHLPLISVDMKKLQEKWTHLKTVEVSSMCNAQPRILIGQDNCNLIIPREIIEGPPNAPVLSRSLLGWSVHGNLGGLKTREEEISLHTWENNMDEEMHQMIKDSFKTENFGVMVPKKKLLSDEDERAMQILEATTKRVGNGWETGLLWRKDDPVFPESYSMAQKRLLSIEKQMIKNPVFNSLYKEKIEEYITKGYARKVENIKPNKKTWFIPHFAVYNSNKPGKLRMVFDAAAKSNGTSLNDELLSGPDLLKSLTSVLFKFRQREIGFGGDIKEMFHRIQIRDEDLASQRFLWRNGDSSRDPTVYEMKAMTFGSTSSPCCAQYVKNKNAMEFIDDYPEAVKAITDRHYVDDYFDSAHDEADATKRIAEVTELHCRGGFLIRNWTCSSEKVLSSIPEDLKAAKNQKQELIGGQVERVLGVNWDANNDCFTFLLNFSKVRVEILEGRKTPTKREMLRLVMSLFDPLGFLTNFTVAGKIIMQDVWRQGLGWDDELSGSVLLQWNKFISELHQIKNVTIPRCYSLHMKHCSKIELHVFCDASEKAFASVAYFKIFSKHGIKVSFVMSKSRVSPLRPISIPRLELQAATLGSRLSVSIKENHEINIDETHFWSDSKTVLCWIRSDQRKYKQFVACRVGEILELTDVKNWHWVPTKLNPADDATRNIAPVDFNPKSCWLQGPPFLLLNEAGWPKETKSDVVQYEEESEMKKEITLAVDDFVYKSLPDVKRFSSWTKLIRSTAWTMRFINNSRSAAKVSGELSVDELNAAEKRWWSSVQEQCYPLELKNLKKDKKIEKSSVIYQLSPQLDKDAIIRINGRINKCSVVPLCTRKPVILDPHHLYTRLLMNHIHLKYNHNGMEAVANELRQHFWIPKLRISLRSIWSHCQYCKNRRSKLMTAQMGELPEERLQCHVKPFTSVGLDFFGPINIKNGKKREKRYGVLFTCLSTRGVHLEVANSLSTDACIMAIRRMVSRRGLPHLIVSDNGTNLRGAHAELKEAIKELDQNRMTAALAEKRINWKFNPPSCPHMGGAWERLIRSVKTTMKTILRDHVTTDEMLRTVIVEAEAIVNSRPLTHVSLDHEDEEALTPNHFIMGCSSPISSPGVFQNSDLLSKKQWRTTQKLIDHFWARWIKEYIPCLTRRTKWHEPGKQLQVGSVVILADSSLPRGVWPKGRVIRTFPGSDGQVRVAEIQTQWGTFRRPITKMCLLDFTADGDNSQ